MKYIDLTLVVGINDEMSKDEFFNKLIEFVETHGDFYSGTIKEFDPIEE